MKNDKNDASNANNANTCDYNLEVFTVSSTEYMRFKGKMRRYGKRYIVFNFFLYIKFPI